MHLISSTNHWAHMVWCVPRPTLTACYVIECMISAETVGVGEGEGEGEGGGVG